jgi:NADP-dependent 3-hydroxy acid dehydrogenase YdfG
MADNQNYNRGKITRQSDFMCNDPSSYFMITGAAGGLGSTFTLACARKGKNLLLVDQNPQISNLIQGV